MNTKTTQIATAIDFGGQLVKALGLPDRCISIDLHVEVGEPVTVTARHYVGQLGQEFFDAIATEYQLVRNSAPTVQSQAFSFDAWLRDRKDRAHRGLIDSHAFLSRMDARLFGVPT